MRSTTTQRLRANTALNGLSQGAGARAIVYGTERVTGNVMTPDEVREYFRRSYDFTSRKPSLWSRVRKFIRGL